MRSWRVGVAAAAPATAAATTGGSAGGLEVRRDNHRGLRGLEIVDHAAGLGAADDDRIEVELLGEGQRPEDLALLAGLEGDRHLALERGRQRVERRLEAADHRALVAVGEGPGLLLPLRVVERLPREGDDAEEGAGISAATAALSSAGEDHVLRHRRTHHHRAATVGRERAGLGGIGRSGQVHERALAADDPLRRHGERRRDAGRGQPPHIVAIELDQRGRVDVGMEVAGASLTLLVGPGDAVGRRHRGAATASSRRWRGWRRLRGGGPHLDHRRIRHVDHARVDHQPGAVDEQGVGGRRHRGADVFDDPLAHHHGALVDDRPGGGHDPGVGDGVAWRTDRHLAADTEERHRHGHHGHHGDGEYAGALHSVVH